MSRFLRASLVVLCLASCGGGGNYYATLSEVMEARIPKRAEEYKKSLDEAVAEQLQLNREGEERRAEEEYERDEFKRREGFQRPFTP